MRVSRNLSLWLYVVYCSTLLGMAGYFRLLLLERMQRCEASQQIGGSSTANVLVGVFGVDANYSRSCRFPAASNNRTSRVLRKHTYRCAQ